MSNIFITLLIFVSSITAWGQTLLETTGKTSQKVMEIETRIAVTDYQQVNINLDILKEGHGRISFFGIDEIVYQTKFIVRSFKNFSWYGSNKDNTTSIILTVADKDIQGIVTHKLEVYRIETVGDSYYITKIDHNKYPSDECGNCSKNTYTNTETNNSFNNDSIINEQKLISDEPYTCRLRLLVLYTPAAKNAVSNISNTIQLAVDEMKMSFINSNVNSDIELVYVGETNYTESGLSYNGNDNDLVRFSGTSDGYMDEVHILRNKHQADICILIYNDRRLCGIAKGIKVSASNAFCLVNYDCATGYYSFAHEIAHLIGCQHHPNDYVHLGASSSYPYAHGYKSPNNDWRTIMAYACPGGCTRLLYWSNPNITYGGLPMGTTNTHNNARMLNEKMPNAMSFLQPENTVTVQNADVAVARDGDIIAINKVETSGILTIQSGQSYSFRSGGKVVFKPGFTAKAGCNLVAKIVEVTDCGRPDGENSDYGVYSDSSENISKKSQEQIQRFTVHPNPTSDIITVNIELVDKGVFELSIYDYTGKDVKKLGIYTVSSGKFKKDFNISDLVDGVYFIVLSLDNHDVSNFKIIKNK